MTLRCWLVIALLAPACGFTAPAPTEDEMGDDVVDPAGSTPVARQCNTSDTELRMCIDFEDTPTLTDDGSGRGHDAIATQISVTPRGGQQAALLSADSRIVVGESADLDIQTNLTVSMWARPDGFPTDAYWMLDNNKQYSISYQADGQVRCGLGSATVDSVIWIAPGAWHHVACTYDGAQLEVLIDGSVAGCKVVARPIATDGEEGLAIGANVGAAPNATSQPTLTDQFVGGLDNVQVFGRTWSNAELCAAAGQSVCNTLCPSAADSEAD